MVMQLGLMVWYAYQRQCNPAFGGRYGSKGGPVLTVLSLTTVLAFGGPLCSYAVATRQDRCRIHRLCRIAQKQEESTGTHKLEATLP